MKSLHLARNACLQQIVAPVVRSVASAAVREKAASPALAFASAAALLKLASRTDSLKLASQAPSKPASLAAYPKVHSLTAPPKAHSVAAPSKAHSLAAPSKAHSVAASSKAVSLAAPSKLVSLAAPSKLASLAVLLLVFGCSAGRSPEWSSEFVLDDQGGSSPTTAVDRQSGTAYWAWFGKDDADRPAVFVASLAPSDTVPSARVYASPTGALVNPHPQAPPQIAVAPDGTVYVAWSTRVPVEGRRFPASNLQIARSTDGGRSFEAPIYVNDDHDGEPAGHTFHNLAVGPDGTVYVSWLDSRKSDTLDHSTHTPEEHAQHVVRGAGAAHHPQASSDSNQMVGEATQHHDDASGTAARIARSEDGGQTFEPSVVVARGTCQCCRTGLHVADDGRIYVAWRHLFDGNVRDIAVAWSDDDASTFSEGVRVHADNWEIDGCPHSGPSITTAADGDVHVAWYTAAPERIGLYHAVSADGGQTFGAPEPLEKGVPISSARLAPTSSDPWLVWEDAEEGTICLRPTDEGAKVVKHAGSSPSVAHAGRETAIAWERGDSVLAAMIR